MVNFVEFKYLLINNLLIFDLENVVKQLKIKSGPSTHHCRLKLFNCTPYKIDIYWIDYQSNYKPYTQLNANETLPIGTYVSHPWVFINAQTGEYQQINHKNIFWPEQLILTNTRGERYLNCELIKIHMPLRTLKECALLTIFRQLSNEMALNELADELPKSLIDNLMNMFKLYTENVVRRQN